MAWVLKGNGSTDYVEGLLAASLTGDFTLKYVGTINKLPTAGFFGNLIAIADTSGSGDYLGLALNNAAPSDKIKIISNGATPGAGTTVLVVDVIYTLELRYVQSTNTASVFIDNVFEYSVNPTSGATWIPTCDSWRLLSGTGISSFGASTIRDGTSVIDLSTPANTIEPTPTLSGGTGLILPDASANGLDGTLFGFSGDEWLPVPIEATTSAIPNITTPTIQGLCRDSSFFYMFDSVFSGFTDRIKKVDLSGTITLENTSPFSSLGAGTWKLNDGAVAGGVIYNPVQDTTGGIMTVTRYSASTLAYISHTDITATGAYNAGCCIGHTGNLFFVGHSNVLGNDRTTNVTELTIAGAFVATHTLSAQVFGMQGITWDGFNYYITSHDPVNNQEVIKQFNQSFFLQSLITLDVAITEIEGIEFFGGVYYFNDIATIPVEWVVDGTTRVQDDFDGASGTDLSAHAPNVDFVGGGYIDNGANTVELDGAGAIKFSAMNDEFRIDSGATDQTITTNFNAGGADNRIHIHARLDNNSSLTGTSYRFNFRPGDLVTPLRINRIVAGVNTLLVTSPTPILSNSTTYELKVSVTETFPGSGVFLLDFKVDGVSELSITDTVITSGTFAGIRHATMTDGNARFFDLKVEGPVAPAGVILSPYYYINLLAST